MTRWSFGVVAGALVIGLAACGGRDSMASRSAAAHEEAMKKGMPVGADGHGDHGHQAPQGGAPAAGHDDHSMHGGTPASPSAQSDPHAMHGGAPASTVQTDPHAMHRGAPASSPAQTDPHAMHRGAPTSSPAQTDPHAMHRGAPATPPAQTDPHAMHRGAPAASPAQNDPHAMHGATAASIPQGGLWGPVAGAMPATPRSAPALPLASAPRSNAAMSQVRPDATLKADDADTPAAISVMEAQKASRKEQP